MDLWRLDISGMLVFKNANKKNCKGLFAFDYAHTENDNGPSNMGFKYNYNENCNLLKRSLRFKLDRR
jgi:hypothetical protein